jgi:glutamate synthase (NADPH/NADH) small chain
MLCKHTRVDGFGISRHIVDQDKFLSRFNQFKPQEQASKIKHAWV